MRQLRFGIFSLFFMVLFSAGPVFSGPQADLVAVPKTCDAEFYKMMSNRAWMEGQREMEIAQTLILKPDSVLEYSCFNEIIEANAQGTGFTPASNGMNVLIWPALNEYLESNFPHTLGGGKYTAGAQGTCNAMYKIWDFLRCNNFDKGDFKSFLELYNEDPRALPQRCNAPQRAGNWEAALKASNPLPKAPAEAGGASLARTYFDILDPTDCAKAKPIPTGLIMSQTYQEETTSLSGETDTVTKTKEYFDAACTAPGCSLNPGGGSQPSCVAVATGSSSPAP